MISFYKNKDYAPFMEDTKYCKLCNCNIYSLKKAKHILLENKRACLTRRVVRYSPNDVGWVGAVSRDAAGGT